MKTFQVLFWYDGAYYPGILIGVYIIDARGGGTIEAAKVLSSAPQEIKPILRFKDWADLTTGEILTGEDFWAALVEAYGDKFDEIVTKFAISSEF